MENKVQARINKIEVLEYSINNSFPPDELIGKDINFVIDTKLNIISEKEELNVDTSIDVFPDVNSKERICNLISRVTFTIKNLNDLIYIEANTKLNINGSLLKDILETSIYTTRGILYVKNLGTILANSYLPMFNITQYLQEPGKIIK